MFGRAVKPDCLFVGRQRLVDLFPNAESSLTRKLASMTFCAKSMMSDLVKFRHFAKHSSLGKMLDANECRRPCQGERTVTWLRTFPMSDLLTFRHVRNIVTLGTRQSSLRAKHIVKRISACSSDASFSVYWF